MTLMSETLIERLSRFGLTDEVREVLNEVCSVCFLPFAEHPSEPARSSDPTVNIQHAREYLRVGALALRAINSGSSGSKRALEIIDDAVDAIDGVVPPIQGRPRPGGPLRWPTEENNVSVE